MMLSSARIRRPAFMRYTFPAAFALALAAAIPAHAQTVQGRAVDRETQQPIADASLALVNEEGETVATGRSRADGTFRLTAPRAGEYRVTASRIGYRTMLSAAVPLAAGETVAVEARITPQPVVLDTAAVQVAMPAGISGRVLDQETDRGIAGATVTLLDSRGLDVDRVTTDDAGRFHLPVRRPGAHQLRAERMGYTRATSPAVTVVPDDTMQVELRLSTGALVLAPLTVVAASRSVVRERQLAEFEWRRTHQPWGRYVGPERMKHINPFYATDVLQQVPFVQVHDVGFQRIASLRAPYGRGRCLPTVYVDGHHVPTDGAFSIDSYVSGSTVAAVEVYDRPALAPAEYAPQGRNQDCGVVVIWTRPPGQPRG